MQRSDLEFELPPELIAQAPLQERSASRMLVLDPQLAEAMDLAKKIGAAAEKAGADVLIDDRAERPGVKFKDADLIGIPLRLTIGGKGLKEGVIELKWRTQKEVAKIPVAEAEARVAAAVAEAAAKASA